MSEEEEVLQDNVTRKEAGAAATALDNSGGPLKKGPWTAAEDIILVEYVKTYGEGNWNSVQKKTGLARCGKSCRLRWTNHLRPNLKKGSFSAEEERLILQLHSKLGNKWARMAAQLPGRTDNEIKNYWNTRMKRRIRQGLPLYPQPDEVPMRPNLTRFKQNVNNCDDMSSRDISSPRSQAPLSSPQSPIPTYPSTLSGLQPMSLSSQISLPIHNRAPILSSSLHKYKRFRPNNMLTLPYFSLATSRTLRGHTAAPQLSPVSPRQLDSPNFECHRSAIPLTRFVHGASVSPMAGISVQLGLPSSPSSQSFSELDDVIGGTSLSNNGPLDTLLQEPQVMNSGCGGYGGEHSREGRPFMSDQQKHIQDDLCPTGPSLYKEDIRPNAVQDDLSSIFNAVNSAIPVHDLYKDGDIPGGQSPSTADDHLGIDIQQLLSSFPIVSSTNPEWTVSDSCSWSNLPGLC